MTEEEGFTLIELLVVIAIIGILASIAIPQYASYRKDAFNERARSDLRNAISAQEALYADSEAYVTCSNSDCAAPALPGFQLSDGVLLELEAAGEGYTGSASHPKGDVTFNFDSTTGLIIKDTDSGDSGMSGM